MKLRILISAGALVVLCAGSAFAQTFAFSWTGLQIQGEEEFGTGASGSAIFKLTGTTLTLTLTTTSSGEQALGHLLSGVVWDMEGVNITSGHDGVGTSALVPMGSGLVGDPIMGFDGNLSREFAWKHGDLAGSWDSGWTPPGGATIGAYGVSAVGNGAFGAMDVFDLGATNWMGGTPPDGPDGMLIGPGNPLSTDGLTMGTYVENSMVFTWHVSKINGTSFTVTNVNPFFGTDGAFAVPEPGTLVLLGSALAGVGLLRRRKKI